MKIYWEYLVLQAHLTRQGHINYHSYFTYIVYKLLVVSLHL